MEVLIIGGTGLIGHALVEELKRTGHHAIIVSRQPSTHLTLPDNVDAVQWDGQTLERQASVIDAVDAIVNLAGENIGSGLWTPARKKRILESRLQVGRAVTEVVARAERKPQVVVQASAIGYYGFTTESAIDEASPPGSDWLANVAVRWETSTAGVERYGTRQVVIRSGLVLSRQGGALTRMTLPFRLLVGGPLGKGDQVVSWIHIRDEAAAIRFLIEHSEAQGPFNLTAPYPVTNAEFGRTLASVIRRPYWLRAPAWALRLVLGEMSQVVLEGQRVIPRHLKNLGFEFRYPDLPSALGDVFSGRKG